MSTLTTTRIREHALKLGMTHLTDTISELVARAETDQMGYLDFRRSAPGRGTRGP